MVGVDRQHLDLADAPLPVKLDGDETDNLVLDLGDPD